MKLYKTILLPAILAVAVSCESYMIPIDYGDDRVMEELLSSPAFSLRSAGSARDMSAVLLTEGGSSVEEAVYVSASEVSCLDQTVVVSADTSLVEAWSEKMGVDCKPLPAPFYEIADGGVLSVPAGESVSELLKVRFHAVNALGNRIEPGNWLLPLKAVASSEEISADVIYFFVKVREPYDGNAPLYTGDDFFFVFYLNTSDYDPRLLTDYLIDKEDLSGKGDNWYCTIGNVINLRKNIVGYDAATGYVRFSPSADMKYVLSHYSTYILPLQEEGRKVCLSIEGGATGLGFCNMTDSQIEDFVSQVKMVMDTWPLDGINLWDRNSDYAKSAERGLPAMNTTSYPKLIKALREMLGEDRLLTLTDYEEPTEYFWDTEATGSIEVGKYLDYAWSGYCDENVGPQIVDPYHPGGDGVSTLYSRQPIAGLDASRYGCLNVPWRPNKVSYDIDEIYGMITLWVEAGNNQNNILLFDDVRTQLQDTYEHGTFQVFDEVLSFYDLSALYTFDKSQIAPTGYGKWQKDW